MKKLLMIVLMLYSCVSSAADIIVWKENKEYICTDIYTVQKIFTRKITRWPTGQPIYVFTKPLNSIEHRDFVTNTLHLTPYYFQQQLEEQTYAGKASSVAEVSNDGQMKLKIENTPGSIGYLNYEIYVGDKRVVIVNLDNISLK